MPFSFKIPSALARHHAIAAATRDLEAHSDRVLADMGVSRRDIAVIARGGYARPAAAAGARASESTDFWFAAKPVGSEP